MPKSGMEGSKRRNEMNLRKRFLIWLSGAVCCAAVAMAQTAPTSVFQLNGNAANSSLGCFYGPCDYWNLLNGTGNNISGGGIGAGSSAGQSAVRTFINGTSSTFGFQGGGSKDPNPISPWSYAVTGSPNKDTINAAYAAAYTQGGAFTLIFGADRLSPNGDANIGIWFFQQKVVPNGSGSFTGAHADHDIFVISSFTVGGGTSNVSVFEWDHTCASGVKNPGPGQCADSNLRTLALATGSGVCGSSPYCATTNPVATTSTWEGSLASPLFFEGGVNLTAAFSAVGITQLPCFSSFLVETRSSQSTTSVLKDFLAGGFPVCGMSLTKSCGTPAVTAGGTAINYPVNGLVTNTGVGTLYNVTVFDTIGSLTPATTCTSPGCDTIFVVNNTPNSPNLGSSTLGAGETGTWSDSSTTTSLSQPDVAIAKGSTSSASGATLDVTSSSPAQQTCMTTVSTSLTVTKLCTTSLNASAQVQVGFSGKVCNTGPSQVTGVSLVDYPSNSSSGNSVTSNFTLAPAGAAGGADCASYSGTYSPTHYDSIAGDGTGPGRYFFNDLITISGATPTVGGPLTPLKNQTDTRCNGTFGCTPASCPLCQGPGECTAQ
jgi:hypothetical protein